MSNQRYATQSQPTSQAKATPRPNVAAPYAAQPPAAWIQRALADPGLLRPDEILHLQRIAGNQATAQLIAAARTPRQRATEVDTPKPMPQAHDVMRSAAPPAFSNKDISMKAERGNTLTKSVNTIQRKPVGEIAQHSYFNGNIYVVQRQIEPLPVTPLILPSVQRQPPGGGGAGGPGGGGVVATVKRVLTNKYFLGALALAGVAAAGYYYREQLIDLAAKHTSPKLAAKAVETMISPERAADMVGERLVDYVMLDPETLSSGTEGVISQATDVASGYASQMVPGGGIAVRVLVPAVQKMFQGLTVRESFAINVFRNMSFAWQKGFAWNLATTWGPRIAGAFAVNMANKFQSGVELVHKNSPWG